MSKNTLQQHIAVLVLPCKTFHHKKIIAAASYSSIEPYWPDLSTATAVAQVFVDSETTMTITAYCGTNNYCSTLSSISSVTSSSTSYSCSTVVAVTSVAITSCGSTC
jgi:hypothetical protein